MALRKLSAKLAALTIGVLVCLVLLGAVYRFFFLWFVHVPTGAMMNTILPGDHLIFKREFGEISRGAVVMFRYPDGSQRYVSRVIGLPRETVHVRGRSVYINALELPEEKGRSLFPKDNIF